MTSTIPTDAATHVVCAYRWLDRGDVSLTEATLRRLSVAELRDADRTVVRLAQIVAALLQEADPCPWCPANPCPDREVHNRLDAMAEGTWIRRARGMAP